MRYLILSVLLTLPLCGDTLWTLTGTDPVFDVTTVFDLIVPSVADGNATNVISWSRPGDGCGCTYDYFEFGDITDYLGIYWPNTPATPTRPPATLSATPQAAQAGDIPPITFYLGGLYGLDTSQVEAVYSAMDFGDTPTGPQGPFTVADPPLPSNVPEPGTFGLLSLGLLAARLWASRLGVIRRA